ncbi:MAG: TrkH family potassium uptake protein [Puniceicoccales bacterium]|jgi:trk system potassium uptake protein TrkH|nr:TrkH family potassium uptake protein [Puniceicoccales bacterium]
MKVMPLVIPLAINFLLLSLCFWVCAYLGFFCYKEPLLPWIPAITIPLLLSLIFYFCKGKQKKLYISQREILLTTGLSWLSAGIIGSLPYWILLHCKFSVGLFESISGLTTTGATALLNLECLPKGLLLWRSVSQWLGGLGFVVFFVTFLGTHGNFQKQLYLQESTSVEESVSLFRMRKNISYSLLIYICLTIMCALSLFHCNMSLFDAICHALTTVSTGGFSTYSAGIHHFNSLKIERILIIFMLLGSINFVFLIQIFTRHGPRLVKNSEFRTYIAIILVVTLVCTRVLYPKVYPSLPEAGRHALFQVVSIGTTTGFHSVNFADWPNIAVLILLLLMFIGGCTGSTAGGFKVFRMVALCKILLAHLEKIFRSNIVRILKIDGVLWNERKQLDLLYFFALNLLVIFISVIFLQILIPSIDFLTNVSAIVASLSNIGPGLTSLIGPNATFLSFPSSAKILLSALMLLGRLEIYAILVLLTPRFWKRFD